MNNDFKELLDRLDNDPMYDFSSQEDYLEFIWDEGRLKGKAEKISEEIFDSKLEWILQEYGQWTSSGYQHESYDKWRQRIKKELLK